MRPTKLSGTFVARVRTPVRYGDGRGGNGLSLLVKTTASGRISRSWTQRLRIYGRQPGITGPCRPMRCRKPWPRLKSQPPLRWSS